VTIRNLRIVEEKNDWMPEILAKMIITLMYVVVGLGLVRFSRILVGRWDHSKYALVF